MRLHGKQNRWDITFVHQQVAVFAQDSKLML